MIVNKMHLIFLCVLVICASCKKQLVENNTSGLQKLYPFEDHFLQKQFPENGFAVSAYFRALQSARTFSKNVSNRSNGKWLVQGPGNIGARANTIAVALYAGPFSSFDLP